MTIYPQIYYVYFYLRSKDSKTAKAGTPYYVGKGCKNRYKSFHGKHISIPEESKILIVDQELTELQAFILERYYIRWFGRKDLGTGILRNRTEGGEGVSSEDSRRYAFERVKNKTHNFLKREDGTSVSSDTQQKRIKNKTFHFLGGEIQKIHTKKLVDAGIHHLLKREDGSSWGSDVAKMRVKNGDHHFLTRNDGTNIQTDRISKGIHNLIGTVTCYDIDGICHQIPKEIYYSQTGPKETWKYVHNQSFEGRKRSNKTIEVKIPCINLSGKKQMISKNMYYSQKGPKEIWEWVTTTSKEGTRRKLL